MADSLAGVRIGFALTGSFCMLDAALEQMEKLVHLGAHILPIISFQVRDTDTRFGTAAHWRQRISHIAGTDELIDSIPAAEPIGPKRLCDILLIAPCTGNSAAKLANGIIDTPVLMAAKAHLRNARPLAIAIASNDALAANARNLGTLLNFRRLFFVPFGQDDPFHKPNSIIARMELIPATVAAALKNQQIQPILSCKDDTPVV